jgi:hypothetical protein
MEFFIFKKVDYNLILVSPYEFIKTYIYDFYHNNESKIKNLNMAHHLLNMESAAIYMAKLMLHDDSFCQYK